MTISGCFGHPLSCLLRTLHYVLKTKSKLYNLPLKLDKNIVEIVVFSLKTNCNILIDSAAGQELRAAQHTTCIWVFL